MLDVEVRWSVVDESSSSRLLQVPEDVSRDFFDRLEADLLLREG